MIRLLTFTNLYPSIDRARHGIFVEQRLRRLVETGKVHANVVVPVAQDLRASGPVPATIRRFGIEVRYVGFRAARGLTTFVNPLTMALAAKRLLRNEGPPASEFDLIDAHFLYPDGVAAVLLGKWFGKPVVLTARGSDVNVAARERVAGFCIRWAVNRAAAVITVSAALREELIARGVPRTDVAVVRNGVDLSVFDVMNRSAVRETLGIAGPTLLSVGNLVPEKGHRLVIEALGQLGGARLVVIGSGPDERMLRELADRLGVGDRISWLAPLPQEQLARYYNAADLTVLASTREGMPNVLLESLACGTPVVAAAVGGCVEIVTSPEAGRLLPAISSGAIAAACRELLERPTDRAATRRYAERFGWKEPIENQLAILQEVRDGRRVSAVERRRRAS